MNVNLIYATQLLLQATPNTVHQRMMQSGPTLFFKPLANRIAATAKMIGAADSEAWEQVLRRLKVGQFVAVGNFLVEGYPIDHPIVVDGRV